jgi:uncharacterized protein (DUF1697 family)
VRYVALLRGINVGGETLMKMADLKACLDGLGLDQVSTYIASGNVLFAAAEMNTAELETRIHAAIHEQFNLPVKVVVLDRAAYGRIVKAIPGAWQDDASIRANVGFVSRGINTSEVVRELQPDPAVEQVEAVDGAILWATKRDSLNRSVMRKLVGGPVYKEMTVRSLATTLKLHRLLDESSPSSS